MQVIPRAESVGRARSVNKTPPIVQGAENSVNTRLKPKSSSGSQEISKNTLWGLDTTTTNVIGDAASRASCG